MPKKKAVAIAKQAGNNGEQVGRDSKGKFAKGHTLGFQPGQSGNPKGRPKSITLSEAYRYALAQPMEGDALGRTYAEVIADEMVAFAAMGNIHSAKEIADRTEGKPRQAIDMTANVMDWRELAKANGLSLTDVFNEAKRIIESGFDSSGSFAPCEEPAE